MQHDSFQTPEVFFHIILAEFSALNIAIDSENNDKPTETGLVSAIEEGPSSECIQALKWRWAVQRAFLHRSIPTREEMPKYDELFRIIEQHDFTSEMLVIGKVMRHITLLEPEKLCEEEKYHIRDRANILLKKWSVIFRATAA
ncbi:hypothetical protein Clacol_010494 [Clathrus columnatus]|uniref:TFIIS N-terminal domain-containing protein n=1 Tax=Clathrus columnatus TaxID=1419009 RepID=A0AAV5A2H7_9AGAM|nr:hypothetical protein Clacol_001034 [Clathrus columnatus]GJJ16198.1 hypothetical protein Clacol_010494 [Clathrus columnatus]